jgi:acyl dehydratase
MSHERATKTPDEVLYLDDLYVGRRFTSRTHALDERQIVAFARDFDPQPFHTNSEAAKGTLFRDLVASGWHTAAITMRLQVDGGLPIAGGIVGLGGELGWPTATRPGDVLHVESEVLDVVPSRSRPDRGTLTLRSETRNQRGEVVQTATIKLLVPRRSMTDSSAVTTKASTRIGVLRGPAGTETKPEARVASYVIALSQTDTAEQTEWTHAPETRRKRVDLRSRAAVQAVSSAHDLPPTTDEPAAAERREHGRT